MIKKPIISEENKEKNKDRMFRDIWTLLKQKKKKKKERDKLDSKNIMKD